MPRSTLLLHLYRSTCPPPAFLERNRQGSGETSIVRGEQGGFGNVWRRGRRGGASSPLRIGFPTGSFGEVNPGRGCWVRFKSKIEREANGFVLRWKGGSADDRWWEKTEKRTDRVRNHEGTEFATGIGDQDQGSTPDASKHLSLHPWETNTDAQGVAWIGPDGCVASNKLYSGEDGNSIALAPRGKDLRDNARIWNSPPLLISCTKLTQTPHRNG